MRYINYIRYEGLFIKLESFLPVSKLSKKDPFINLICLKRMLNFIKHRIIITFIIVFINYSFLTKQVFFILFIHMFLDCKDEFNKGDYNEEDSNNFKVFNLKDCVKYEAFIFITLISILPRVIFITFFIHKLMLIFLLDFN